MTMTITISTAKAEDAAALAECAAVTFPLACPPDSRPEDVQQHIATRLSAEQFRMSIATPGQTILCIRNGSTQHACLRDAERGSEPIAGYSIIVLAQPTDDDVLGALSLAPVVELSKFYVRPEYHGRGAAAALMSATLKLAAASGLPGVWLGVNQENARAIRFYTKNGFRRVGTKRFRLGDRFEDDFILEQALPVRSDLHA